MSVDLQRSALAIPTADGVADAYRVRPTTDEAHPGVLLLIDGFGLRPRIRDMADRIAAEGYAVLAPNLLYRAGTAPVIAMPDLTVDGEREAFVEKLRPLAVALSGRRLAGDGDAYLHALGATADRPVGVVGYCFSVRLGLQIAMTHHDRIAAFAGFHGGGLVTDADDSVHLHLSDLASELYLGHADADRTMPPDAIAAFDAALDAADVKHRTEVYAGAAHGFTMADTPVYDEAATERHFEALLELFGRTLAAD